MTVSACLFDMGNVLVYFSHERMCRNVAEVCGIDVAAATDLMLHEGLQWKLETGDSTEEEFHADIEARLKRSIDFEALKIATADIFTLNESIVPLLRELRELQIRLVLLSNTSFNHLSFIQRHFKVLQEFDALTTSFEVGVLKPGDAIYHDAVAKAGCSAENCFYTDDIEDYVLKARTLGIQAEVFTDSKATRTALRTRGVPVAAE